MQTWLAQWTQLMRDITSDPVAKAMVMVDILNEPDSRGLTCASPSLLGSSVMPCKQRVALHHPVTVPTDQLSMHAGGPL